MGLWSEYPLEYLKMVEQLIKEDIPIKDCKFLENFPFEKNNSPIQENYPKQENHSIQNNYPNQEKENYPKQENHSIQNNDPNQKK